MRRRKLLLGVATGLVVLAGAAAFALWPPRDRVTDENFDRIRPGMSRAEIIAILGQPGDYTTGDTELDFDREGPREVGSPPDFSATPSPRTDLWDGNRGSIIVRYTPNDEVCDAAYLPDRPVDHGPLGNLGWRLKRQWQRWFPPK